METEKKEIKERKESIEVDVSSSQSSQQLVSSEKKQQDGDGEIDLIEIFKNLWANRVIVYVSVFLFFIFGVFIAVVSQEEYTSNVVLMPQSASSTSNAGSSLLRQFGGLAGLDLGGGSSGSIGINLYPEITQSTPFFLYLLEQEVYVSNLDTTVSTLTYFTDIQQKPVTDYIKTYTIGLPKLILGFPSRVWESFKAPPKQPTLPADSLEGKTILARDSTHQPVKLSGRQLSAMGKLKSRIETSIENNGMVSVKANMPDPYMAAQVTELAVEYLKQYITEYRTEKSQSNLEFLEKQYEKAKERYYNTQQRLARFRDMNSNIVTASGQTELERLQNENNLAYNVYQGLAQQLEQARITVQEETPVFKVLEPIQVPLGKSAPNRELIIFIAIFLGFIVGMGIIVAKVLYQKIKEKFIKYPSY